MVRDGEGDHRTAGIRFSYELCGAKHYESMRYDFWVDGMAHQRRRREVGQASGPPGSKTESATSIPKTAADVVLSRNDPTEDISGV